MTQYPYGSCQDAAARTYQSQVDREYDPPDEEAEVWQRLTNAECPEDREKAAVELVVIGVPLREIERMLDQLDNQWGNNGTNT